MSVANPLWGAARIHGELLKVGIDVGQTSVAKYMVRHTHPPSQGWRTFPHNHADGIASMDLFVVPTVSFRLRYGLLILRHRRREILWLGVTAHPTAEWIGRQLTEAYGWTAAPTMEGVLKDCLDHVEGDYAGVGHPDWWKTGGQAGRLNSGALNIVCQEMTKALHKVSAKAAIEV
jgi:hypothetical protein